LLKHCRHICEAEISISVATLFVMTQPTVSLSETSVRKSNPPVRLRMASNDVLSRRSMEVEWESAVGKRQGWSSWDDPMCGFFDAEVLLPSDVTKITVRFKVRTIFRAFDVYKIDRGNNNSGFFKPKRGGDYIADVFNFRHASTSDTFLSNGCATGLPGVDATFVLAGAVGFTHICWAWNAGRDGPAEPWEFWEDEDTRPSKQLLAALKAADKASKSCTPGENLESDCAKAYRRFVAAVKALQQVRRETISKMNLTDQQLTGQWVAVNSVNTISAGLGIASVVASLLAPAMGIGLGISSAVAGIGATVGDIIADKTKLWELRQQMSLYAWNTAAVSELYEVWMRESRRLYEVGRPVVMEHFSLDCIGLMSAQGVRVAAGVATVGARGSVVAGRVLGAAGAFVSTGIALHGWATAKTLQRAVRQRHDQLAASTLFTEHWLANMNEPECPVFLLDNSCRRDWRQAPIVYKLARPPCEHMARRCSRI